jgi:hypothetical protein
MCNVVAPSLASESLPSDHYIQPIIGPTWHPSRRPEEQELSSGDSSEPLFDLYSKVAKDEDNEMTEHWKNEATDGVLIFVSHHVHH